MTVKKRHTHKSLGATEVHQLNENLDSLYSHKIESRFSYRPSASASVAAIFQAMETGEATFSATGSATVARTFSLAEQHGSILFAQAHAKSTLVTAHVTDVTSTAITIECRTVSGTALFSSVTTASISVWWSVIGSSP